MNTRSNAQQEFGEITETFNPITGCLHECVYCWARKYSKRLASMGVRPYKSCGFKPVFADWRLKQKFPRGSFIFVSDMGDMWGEWVPKEWIQETLKYLRARTHNKFLFLTKNPIRYLEFLGEFSRNMMLGATIETNRDYRLAKAPLPTERFKAMKELDWRHKALVIEPILDFDPVFVDWIMQISPGMVYIGYDNYSNNLPEPKLEKTKSLLREIIGKTEVRAKALRKAWYE